MTDGLQITWPWPTPFSESPRGTLTEEQAADQDVGFYPIAIDGREFLVDLTSGRYRRNLVEVLRTRQNTQPNENLLLSPEVWRSTTESWHQGAGQTRKDRDDSLPYRFFASKGINPWDKWGITLLPATEQVTADIIGEADMVTTTNGVYILDNNGTRLRLLSNLSTQTLTTVTLPSNVASMATDGTTLYVALLDTTVKKITGTTVEDFCDLPAVPSLVVYLKGLVLAACGPALYDISTGIADDTTLVYTHPLPSHRWVDGTDGLAAGYLLGGQGTKWFAYWITVRDDAATFDPPVVAAPLPEGEVGYSLGSYLGFILIGTDVGVRFCVANSDQSLTYGRLIFTGRPVKGMEGEDRFVWFGVGGAQRNTVQSLMQPEAGLARMDLSTFTAPLTPAYAADLVASDEPYATAMSPVTYQGRRLFAVPNYGVYVQSLLPVDEGWLTEGVINQQTRDQKIALYAQVSCEPLRGAIYTELVDDSDQFVDDPQVRIEAFSAVSSGNVDLLGLRFDGLVVRHTLRTAPVPQQTALDGTERLDGTPRLTRFEVRTWPVPGRAHEWSLPIILTDRIEYENAGESRSARDDLDHLLALPESGRTFTFREVNRSYRCFAVGYEWFPTHSAQGFMDFQGVFVLRVRSIT